MHELVDWVRAQLDEDERVANLAARSGFPDASYHPSWRHEAVAGRLSHAQAGPDTFPHIARHDPARVLRDVEAKHRILDEYDAALTSLKNHPDDLATKGWLLGTIRVAKLLAQPFSDRPGWREEWR